MFGEIPVSRFSCLGPGTNARGLREHLVLHGKARITEGGAPALLQRLAHLYLSPDAVFPPEVLRDQRGWITRITPSGMAASGPGMLLKPDGDKEGARMNIAVIGGGGVGEALGK